MGPVLSFFQTMATMSVTDAEYALLVATSVLCSGLQASRDDVNWKTSLFISTNI